MSSSTRDVVAVYCDSCTRIAYYGTENGFVAGVVLCVGCAEEER